MQLAAKMLMIWLTLAAVGMAEERYTIQRGDTLWEIAQRYLPDETITTYQMMLAFFDANPEAFINNDIDQLKVGYTLRIPTRASLGLPSAPPAAEDERGVADTTTTEPLLPVTQEPAAASAIVAEDMAKLQNELALTQEQAAQQQAENEALRTRIAALEARVVNLDERASAPVAVPRPPSRISSWLPTSTMMFISGALVLGIVVIGIWVRRAMAKTNAAETMASATPQIEAEPPATEDTGPLASGLSELEMETETAVDATLAHLIIGLEDLELEPTQAGAAPPGLSSAASIASKADPPSSSNAC